MSCLSDLALDRLIAADSGDTHVAGCERCRTRLELLRDDRVRAQPLVEAILARSSHAAAPKQRWLAWLWAPALAVPALVALFTFLPRAPDDGGDVRVKGGASMRFVVQRGAELLPGTSDARCKPGDALRFIVTPADGEYFLLVGLEAGGKVSVYFPYGGERSERVERHKETVLPGSLVLDASPNDEIFLGLFSRQPLNVRDVRAALADSRNDEAAVRALALPADKRWVTIHKERP